MAETTTIILPRSMSLIDRISEVRKRLTAWTSSLPESFNDETDALRMKKCEQKDEVYIYHYIIDRKVRLPDEEAIALLTPAENRA